MGSTWRDSVVRLRVDAGVDGSVWGTGFFIAPDLVMTALHVVSPGYRHGKIWNGSFRPAFLGRDAASSTATGEEPGGRQAPEGKRASDLGATLIWPTAGTEHRIDAAVLRVEGRKNSNFLLLGSAWSEHAPFESYGFPGPRISLNSIPIHGKTGAVGRSLDAFSDLSVESATLDDSYDWAGVSGSPVFVEGRVIGIVVRRVEVGRAFLRAVPIELVRGASGFSAIPGINDASDFRKLEEEIRRLLAPHPAAVAAVKASMPLDQANSAVAHEWLARKELASTVPVLRLAHQRLEYDATMSGDKKATILAAKAIESALIVCGRDRLHVKDGVTDDGALTCVADQWATIELYLAHRYERGVYFRPIQSANDGLVGRDDLAEPPFTGRDTKKAVDSIRRDLVDKLKPEGSKNDPALNRLLKARGNPIRGADGQYYYAAFECGDGAFGRDETIGAIKKAFSNLPVILRRDVGCATDDAEFTEQDVVTAIADTIVHQIALEERFKKEMLG